jgi:hypothetical protein
MKKFVEVSTGTSDLSGEVGFDVIRVAEAADGDVLTLCQEPGGYSVAIEGATVNVWEGLDEARATEMFESMLK